MYKHRQLVNFGKVGEFVASFLSPFAKDVRIARPMSYFIKGGIDLDGYSNRQPLPSSGPAAPEDIAAGDVDVLTDPTVGKLDLMDYASSLMKDKRVAKEKQVLEKAAGKD